MSILKICYISVCLLWLGCEPTSPNGDPEPCYNPGHPRLPLYAAYQGSPRDGILLFDLNSLAVIDSLETPLTTFNLRISPDSSLLYYPTGESIHLISTCDFSIAGSIDFASHMIEISMDNRYLFLEDHSSQQAFTVMDRGTREIQLSIDTINVTNMVTDPVAPGVYVAHLHPDSTHGTNFIFHFNSETMTIDRRYSVQDFYDWGGIAPVDMKITHDGTQLLIASFTGERGELGRGSILHHIDVVSGEYLAKTFFDAGPALLAITPDDQYAYITDAGSRFWPGPRPGGILRRYHLPSRSISDFIDFRQFDISPSFNRYPVLNRIVLLPDTGKCVITSYVREGADILVVDLVNKELLGLIRTAHDLHYAQQVLSVVLGPGASN